MKTSARYQLIGFTALAGFVGLVGYTMIHDSKVSPTMRITRVDRFDDGFRMNVEFPADGISRVIEVDGVGVIIERADGRKVQVSGIISLDAALNPVFNVNFTTPDCSDVLSDGDRFRLRWRLGVYHEARLSWLTEHLPRQLRPGGEWLNAHTEEDQLVISDWFTLIDPPDLTTKMKANKADMATPGKPSD
jgi:hypothetical protein